MLLYRGVISTATTYRGGVQSSTIPSPACRPLRIHLTILYRLRYPLNTTSIGVLTLKVVVVLKAVVLTEVVLLSKGTTLSATTIVKALAFGMLALALAEGVSVAVACSEGVVFTTTTIKVRQSTRLYG